MFREWFLPLSVIIRIWMRQAMPLNALSSSPYDLWLLLTHWLQHPTKRWDDAKPVENGHIFILMILLRLNFDFVKLSIVMFVSQCHISHLPKIKSQPASAAPSCAESDVSSLRKMSHISLNKKYELTRRSTLGSYFLIFYFTLICLAFVQAKSSANLW